MYMGILCVCATYVPDVYGGWKNASLDPLELELKTVVSCHVGAKNRTWVL